MEKNWYIDFDFEHNPLDIRPNPDVVGLDSEEKRIINYIHAGEVCFVNGLTGSGKTSLLQKVRERLTDFSFIYLNAEDLPQDFNLEEEFRKKKTFLEKITFRSLPQKKAVLVIDEFQATDPNLLIDVEKKFESKNKWPIQAVVVAQIQTRLKNVSNPLRKKLKKHIIATKLLNDELIKEVLRRRLYNKKTDTNLYHKLSPDAVNLLVMCADGSVRRLLEYADMVFDFHQTKFGKNNPLVKTSDYKVIGPGVEEILALNGINVKGFLNKKEQPATTFEKKFSEKEQKMMKFLLAYGPLSTRRLAKRFNFSENKARRVLAEFKNRNLVILGAMKGKQPLWELSNHAKRLMVTV
ncbi:AAA family ATPase [Candidatus Woesearchaeota archaeon]|nr:AAA family ATPase [Candidatus Woesearchaeota archaeon]